MRRSETNSCFSQRPFAAVTMKSKKRNPDTYQYPDFLVHYGIPKMQWHNRRFQNPDGTLTPEGKIRYSKKKEPESSTWKKSDVGELSDEEIRRRNNRLQQERMYKDLTTNESERSRQQLKNDFKRKLITAIAITPVIAIAGVASKKHIGKAISLIGNYAKRKAASYKAANIIRNTLKKQNVPHAGQYNPLRDYALKKHPGWAGIDWLKRIET